MKQPIIYFQSAVHYRFWGRRHSSQQRSVVAALLLLSIIAVVWSIHGLWQAHHRLMAVQYEEAESQAAVAREMETRRQEIELAALSQVQLAPESRRGLNRVIHRLNTPWPQVFEQIERMTPPDLAIIQMEPDSRGVLIMQVESVSLDKLMAYGRSAKPRQPSLDMRQ